MFFTGIESVRSQVADVLEKFEYAGGQTIIKMGASAEHFYLIQSGTCDVIQSGKKIRSLRDGDYFGERALILNTERSATIKATSKLVRCLVMDKASFLRLLNSFYDKFRMNWRNYVFAEECFDDDDDLDKEEV